MSYIGKNPKADTLNLTPQSSLPTTPSEGMLWRSDGTVRGVGLFEYKSGNWIQVDEQLGDSDTLDLQTADGCNLTYNANWYSSGSLNIQGRSDTWGAEREDLSGTGTNDFITLSTTAADLLNSKGVSVIKFAPTDATAGRNSYFGKRVDLQQGWRGSNLVVEFRYKTAESSGDTTDEDWLFVARDASIPPLEIASQGTNTLTTSALAAVVAEDGTTSVYKAPAVGDAIMLTDTSNNTYIRYITVVSGTANAGGTPTITYSGTDLTLPTGTTVNATAMPGIFTSLTQYLPASDDQGSSFKAQVKTDTDTKTIEYGIMHISTQTDQQIYLDNLLLSANKFLQVNTNLKPESYTRSKNTGWWLSSTGGTWSSGATYRVDWSGGTTANTAGPDTPSYDKSKYLDFTTASNDFLGSANTVSVIKAKKKVALQVTVGADLNDDETVRIYLSRGGATGVLVSNTQQRSGSNDTSQEVSASVVLAKDDYVFFYTIPTYSSGWHTIVATPIDSPVVILESQDEIFTDWQSWTPTWLGYGSVAGKSHWRRNGSNMEMLVDFIPSTATGDNVSFSLPSGYVIDSTKFDTTVNTPVAAAGYNTYNTGNYMWVVGSKSTEQDFTKIFLGVQNGTNSNFNRQAGTGFGTGEITGFISVPIQGWDSNFNPLLSMPLVDLGQPTETWFVAMTSTSNFWDGTGVQRQWNEALLIGPNISSTTAGNIADSNLIQIADRTSGTNTVTAIVAKQDIVLYAVVNSYINATGNITWLNQNDQPISTEQTHNADNYAEVCPVQVYLRQGEYIWAQTDAYANDGGITITAQKIQSGNMAHIIKPAVAVFSYQVASGTSGGAISGSKAFDTVKSNVWEGDTWFVSDYNGTLGVGGTNTQFKLAAGTYEIVASQPVYQPNAVFLRLYDVTNSAVMVSGQHEYNGASVDTTTVCVLKGTFTITQTTEFKFQIGAETAQASNGLGVSGTFSGVSEKYLSGMFRKLK